MLIQKKKWTVEPEPEVSKTYIGLFLPQPGGFFSRHTVAEIKELQTLELALHGTRTKGNLNRDSYFYYTKNDCKLYEFPSNALNPVYGTFCKRLKNVTKLGLVNVYRSFKAKYLEILRTKKKDWGWYDSDEFVVMQHCLGCWATDILLPGKEAAERLQLVIKLNMDVKKDAIWWYNELIKLRKGPNSITTLETERKRLSLSFDQKAVFKVNAPSLERLYAWFEKKGARLATYQEEKSTEEFKLWQKSITTQPKG